MTKNLIYKRYQNPWSGTRLCFFPSGLVWFDLIFGNESVWKRRSNTDPTTRHKRNISKPTRTTNTTTTISVTPHEYLGLSVCPEKYRWFQNQHYYRKPLLDIYFHHAKFQIPITTRRRRTTTTTITTLNTPLNLKYSAAHHSTANPSIWPTT